MHILYKILISFKSNLLLCWIVFFCISISPIRAQPVVFKRNSTVFIYQDMDECRSNEYYDFDYFACIACNQMRGVGNDSRERETITLQPSPDKFSCECSSYSPAIKNVYHEIGREQPYCVNICSNASNTTQNNTSNSADEEMAFICDSNSQQCQFQFINFTSLNNGELQLTKYPIYNMKNKMNCNECDMRYNYQYQDYCIANTVMIPYLIYNAFWQTNTPSSGTLKITNMLNGGTHFDDLKFVAFFCLSALRNATACQQLANICVLAHYALDKHSPCGPFLVQQAMLQHLQQQQQQHRLPNIAYHGEGEENDNDDNEFSTGDDHVLRPFIFYKRGKDTINWLHQPIEQVALPHQQLLSTTHALNGRLLHWGPFLPQSLDLCQPYTLPLTHSNNNQEGPTYRSSQYSDCTLSLNSLIDLVDLYNNNNFLSVFLNVTLSSATPTPSTATKLSPSSSSQRLRLIAIPILIEDITPENKRSQSAEWQLVKRFQPLQAHRISHPRRRYQGRQSHIMSRPHTNEYRLETLHSLRYIEHCEFRYRYYMDSQKMALPMLRLRYRHIYLASGNVSLQERFPFRWSMIIEKIDEKDSSRQRTILNEVLLPILLLVATLTASTHAYAFRRRRRTAVRATTPTSTPTLASHSTTSYLLRADAFCDIACILEFVFQLTSRYADALLAVYLLRLVTISGQFLIRKSSFTLPLISNDSDEDAMYTSLLYAGMTFKSIFLVCHLWRISHTDIFFVDWERPRASSCSDSGHHAPAIYNLKSNNLLETSSMCSSVRTYITESNVSAWRIFFTANEWIRLSVEQPISVLLQVCLVFLIFQYFDHSNHGTYHDNTLRLCLIVVTILLIHFIQMIYDEMFGRKSLQRFTDVCSLANVSVFALQETAAYGYYIHGRSPHGFADTDMSAMLLQLQRESHNMCGHRGLLSDSDQQIYIIVPPTNLRTYFEKLLLPLQRSYSISQKHYQKNESNTSGIEINLERTAVAYNSMNRFFCAFIDHSIKDMDYIIKEKNVMEKILNVQFDHYLTENKGTFYIDNTHSFGKLFLQGNQFHLLVFNVLMIICIFRFTGGALVTTITITFLIHKFLEIVFRKWVRSNVSNKTLIDQRFLM